MFKGHSLIQKLKNREVAPIKEAIHMMVAPEDNNPDNHDLMGKLLKEMPDAKQMKMNVGGEIFQLVYSGSVPSESDAKAFLKKMGYTLESLEMGDVNELTDACESLHALMKKLIPNMKSTSKAVSAKNACEKACDDFISLAADEVTDESIVDERTAYMVNPTDYAVFYTAFRTFQKAFNNVAASPKGTDTQKSEFKKLTKQLSDLLGKVDDVIMEMGDTDEVTSEASDSDLKDFAGFCKNATSSQLQNIYAKEKKAGRDDFADVAKAEMEARGVDFEESKVSFMVDTGTSMLADHGDSVAKVMDLLMSKHNDLEPDEWEEVEKELQDYVDGLEETVTGDALMAEIEDILTNKTAKKIDGTLVDMTTANIIKQVADAISPENKAKFLAKGVAFAAQIAWKLAK